MSVTVTMPQLGESVTEGTVTRWLKQVGEEVRADEPLVEVSTDKVDTEIPAPASGVLLSIVVGEDETVAVGAPLGVIGAAGEAPAGDAPAAPAAPEAAAPPAPRRLPPPVGSGADPGRGRSSGAPGGGAGCRGRCRRTRLRAAGPQPAALRQPRRVRHGDPRGPARAGRVRDRGHRDPLAEEGRRHGVGRRAPARGLHRQGRHRAARPQLGDAARDPRLEDETAEVGQTLGVIGTPAPAGAPAPAPAPAPSEPVVAAAPEPVTATGPRAGTGG